MPLCWKAFLENTTPHQQHWACSVQVSPSNHLSAIGQRHLYAADVKMSFVRIIQRKFNGRRDNRNRKSFARQYTPLQGHTAWGVLSGKAFTITLMILVNRYRCQSARLQPLPRNIGFCQQSEEIYLGGLSSWHNSGGNKFPSCHSFRQQRLPKAL